MCLQEPPLSAVAKQPYVMNSIVIILCLHLRNSSNTRGSGHEIPTIQKIHMRLNLDQSGDVIGQDKMQYRHSHGIQLDIQRIKKIIS